MPKADSSNVFFCERCQTLKFGNGIVEVRGVCVSVACLPCANQVIRLCQHPMWFQLQYLKPESRGLWEFLNVTDAVCTTCGVPKWMLN